MEEEALWDDYSPLGDPEGHLGEGVAAAAVLEPELVAAGEAWVRVCVVEGDDVGVATEVVR